MKFPRSFMANARDRLTHLVELASQSAPEKSRALAIELCDLLLDWPEDYARTMRAPFEALIEKVVRGLDGATRRLLAARLASSAETPVDLLNPFFFDVPSEAKLAILARNAEAGAGQEAPSPPPGSEASLLAAMRGSHREEFAAAFGEHLAVDWATAARILDDTRALAVACKGARLTRATFSSIAVLARGAISEAMMASYAHLALFEDISETGARRLLDFWRSRREPARAAEELISRTDLSAYASA
jgi:hypothetical protein